MPNAPRSIWIFHRGALGDSVILWPVLRALKTAGTRVTLVTDKEKADLAHRELGIEGVDIEQPHFNQMWVPLGLVRPVYDVDLVVSFTADGKRGVWFQNSRRAFPGARVRVVARRPDQRLVGRFIRRTRPTLRWHPRLPKWMLYNFIDGSIPRWQPNLGGPIVMHVGAGAESKRWPMERWAELAAALRPGGRAIEVLGGEVEAERFSAEDRRRFAVLGGRLLTSLSGLADAIRPASLFIGADSGPTHLAAALGIHTVAIFGPTDPRRWLPRGPSVDAVVPPSPVPIDEISADRVIASITGRMDPSRRPGRP